MLRQPTTRTLLSLLILLAVASGCSNATEEPMTSEQLSILFGDDAQARHEFRRQVTIECGTLNGLTEQQVVSYLGPEPDSAAGIARQRARLATFGSNILTHLAPPNSPLRLDLGLAPEVDEVFFDGPITNPTTGSASKWGCDTWISGQMNGFRTPAELGADLYRAYGDFLETHFNTHADIIELDQDYLACMATNGFDDLTHRGQHFEQVLETAQQVRAGTIDFQDALEADIAVSLAHYDCNISIDLTDRVDHVADELANEFADEFLSG